jgi:hypothetical protein
MGLTVVAMTHWGRHVDRSFNEFGLSQMGHRFITAFKFFPREPIPIF